MAGIAELLANSNLVTVLGPGGVGKTRLAKESGRELTSAFGGGVWFADLASAEPTTPVGGVIASAVGAQPGGRDPVVALADYFGTEMVLLILDTCEHVRDSVREVVGELLGGSPNLKVLATSRIPLGVDYERIWRLEPLMMGGEQGGAEQLLVERLGSARAEQAGSAAIVELSRRLDGIPLAIELAAARARSSSPEAVLATLDDHARLLRLGQPGADPRQESLAAVVDWSYGLLSPTEQTAFLRLATFAATFSEDTGSAATTDGSIDRVDVAEAIWSLADHSLLVRIDAANETRYGMLETIRAYASHHIDQLDRVATATRIALALLDRVGPWGPITDAWMDEMRVEVDNLRGVIPILANNEPEIAQLLALAILGFLDRDADYISGAREADRYVSELTAHTVARSVLLAQAAGLHHRLGDFDTEPLLDEAQMLVDELGDEPDWASGSIGVQRTERLAALGQLDAALTIATEALQSDLPDRGRWIWLQEVGLLTMEDDPAQAVGYYEQALSLIARDEPAAMAMSHSNIAEGLMRLGEHRRAAEHQLEALRLGEQLGMPILVGLSLVVAARLRAADGEWKDAIRLHGAADRIIEESGAALYPDDVALSDEMLGQAKGHVGDAYEQMWAQGRELEIGEATSEGIHALEEVAAQHSRNQ
jgi:non-specific serine/threonine protein kinase